MTNPHPIPLVVGALHTITTAAAAAAGTDDDPIRVDLGDPGEFQEWRAIGIGLSAQQAGPVDTRQIRTGLGYDHHDLDIACVALAWSGDDTDRIGWMNRAFDLVDLVREELESPANAGLGLDRVVQSARIATSAFSWVQDRQSKKAEVGFVVRVSAYRPRR